MFVPFLLCHSFLMSSALSDSRSNITLRLPRPITISRARLLSRVCGGTSKERRVTLAESQNISATYQRGWGVKIAQRQSSLKPEKKHKQNRKNKIPASPQVFIFYDFSFVWNVGLIPQLSDSSLGLSVSCVHGPHFFISKMRVSITK